MGFPLISGVFFEPPPPLEWGGFWGNFNDGQNAFILEGDVAKCPQCHIDRECDNVMS